MPKNAVSTLKADSLSHAAWDATAPVAGRGRNPARTALAVLVTAGMVMACVPSAEAQSKRPNSTEIQTSLVPESQIPPAPALSADEALASFKIAPGFKLEIAASDPLVQAPVAIAFGADGRMWVVEMRGYMPNVEGRGEEAPIGRVVVLSDRDDDGRYDTSQVFLDELVLPRAIALVGDGAIVGTPPELAYWRDTDGDGVADQKLILASDYGVKIDPDRMYFANPERAPNSLLRGLDNWLYSSSYIRKFRYVNGAWRNGTTIFRGQWGLSHDDRGRFFYNSNSDQLRVDLIFSDYLLRNPNYPRLPGTNVNAAVDQLVWPARVTPGINRGYRPEMLREGRLKEFTAACAPWVYRGDLLSDLRGDVFVAEPSANLVRRNVVIEDGGDLRAQNAYLRDEFITSTDERFRPVNFATGPDGALYIVDMYRGIIQHRIQLTPYLAKQSASRGLAEPHNLGRIYRVVPAVGPVEHVTNIPATTDAQWVEHLAHPNSWWRETAQRILTDSGATTQVPAIRRLVRSSASALGKIHALWTLEGLDELDRPSVLSALSDPSPLVQETGIRLAERFLQAGRDAELVSTIVELARQPNAAVQLQAVLTLGELRDGSMDGILATTVLRNPHNKHLPAALYSAIGGRELALLQQLASDPNWKGDHTDSVLAGLAQGVFASRDSGAIEQVLILASTEAERSPPRAGSLLEGAVAAFASSKRPVRFPHPPQGWAILERDERFQAQIEALTRILSWPTAGSAAEGRELPPLSGEDQKRFDIGKTLYVATCAPCHQPHGGGIEGVAPPLLDSEWVLDAPERLIRIVLHGLQGQIVVAGRTYTGEMPAFGGLDDDQIASVLTYLRREWGHAAIPITPDQVKSIRDETRARSDAWTSRELQQIR